MGFFDFASNIGNKLFGDDDDPAEKIAEHISEDNPGVEGLSVEVNDGVASVKGVAKDQSAFEKAILMAGNALGISEVKADELVLDDKPAVVPSDDQQYTIQKGDTLWAIATEHLGNGSRYTEIVDANLEVIKNADLIFPGQKIRIPK